MVIVEYSPEGKPISDFDLNRFISSIQMACESSNTTIFNVSTSSPIYALRVAVAEGMVDPSKIQLMFCGNRYLICKHGIIQGHPEGLADIHLAFEMRILHSGSVAGICEEACQLE